MERFIKKATIILALVSVTTVVFADRGTGKKAKARTSLNITSGNTSLKSSILSNIKSGLSYKGSFLATRQVVNNSVIVNSTLMTYQKGNTTYIIPYKSKLTVPDVKQGYAGVKLVIRSKK